MQDDPVPQFGEIKWRDIPNERLMIIRKEAADAIHDFFVSIIFEDELRGSGTLIDAWGTLGILTAYHVAQQTLDRDPYGALCLNIADYPHRFEIPRGSVEHIPLGTPPKDALRAGPDLSFIKLSGGSILSQLRSKKSFYRISGKSFDPFRSLKLEHLVWWIAGAPAERSKPMTSKSVEGALAASHLIAEAGFRSLDKNGELDTLRLSLIAGDEPFPKDYRGVSGGGIWVSAFMVEYGGKLDTVEFTPCHLAGVAYYQDELRRGTREILGNGPCSLQSLLKQLKS
jgi:hypothetical protein